MHLIEIPDINFSKEIPSEIGELTTDQFVHFAGLSLKLMQKVITLEQLKTEMAVKFMHIKAKGFDKLDDEAQLLVAENMAQITALLNYFFVDDGNGGITYNLAFTRNFVPWLKTGALTKLKGPADALTDITFLEYKDANTYYRAYQQSQDEKDLNRLIAVLYRPLRFFKKLAYDENTIELRAWHIGKLPMAQRWAIYLFYAACEEFLRSGTLTIDGEEISLEILYTTTVREKQKARIPKYDAKTGLAGVALSLAGTGVFGPIEKVYAQNLYDVLLLLYKQRIEYLNELETLS
jgi:hypothetical protein